MPTSYTEVFGGSVIYPSDPTYLALTISADTVLKWPVEQQIAGNNIVADIIDLSASAPGLSVTMPDASQVSTGYAVLFNNIGSQTVTIRGSTGASIVSLAPATAWEIYLTDNSTSAGVWRTFQYGAATSVANASDLAGSGLKAIVNTLNQAMPVFSKSSNYVSVDSDRANLINWTGGVGTITLPGSATVGNDWFIAIRNTGTGNLTITPTGGDTIDGAVSLVLAPSESCFVVCNGVAFFSVGFNAAGTGTTFDLLGINVAGAGDYTLTGGQLNRIGYVLTGALTGNRNIIVPNTFQEYWVDNETTGAFTLTVKTAAGAGVIVGQGSRVILYCDGTSVVQADTTTAISIPLIVSQGGTGATSAAAARANLGAASTATTISAGTGLTGGGDLSANRTISLSTPVAVTSGGTGLVAVSQGDVIFASAINTLTTLAKDTNATRYLSNTGASNVPAWAQIDLSNGITGNLPVANLNSGTGASANTVWHGDGTWGAVSLSSQVTGNLPVANLNSGTGASASTVWHGNGTWGLVNLGTQVISNLPVANLDSGTNASTSTFWRGDGSWATAEQNVFKTSKAADTSRSSTTVLANDPDLVFSRSAQGSAIVYQVDLLLYVTCASATPDLQFALQCGAGNSLAASALFQDSSTALGGSTTLGHAFTENSGAVLDMNGTNFYVISIKGFLKVPNAVAAALNFQWAQNTSDPTAVVVKAGSWMRIAQMS